MRWFRLGGRREMERDLEDEIGFHLEQTIAELRASGWSAEAAEREAYRRFGNVQDYRRRLRRLDEGRLTMDDRKERLGDLFRDLRQAARAFRREPALTIGIALTLALGIGANATMFGILTRLLLTPPEHVVDVDSLRRLANVNRFRGEEYFNLSREYPDWVEFRGVDAFEDVAVWNTGDVTLGYGLEARRIAGVVASANLFPLLGVTPAHGRFFTEQEDRPGGEPVAVVGHEFWNGTLGGDPDVLGSTLEIDEISYTVVGVAPPGFTGIELARVDVWLPLHVHTAITDPRIDLSGARNPDWTITWLQAVARLEPGVSDEAALAEADAVYEAALPDTDEFQRTVAFAAVVGGDMPRAANDPVVSDESRVSVWLAGVSLVVLLVACANVANMLLARGLRRQGEIGVRLALGVPRARLIRQLLAESVLLALLGGAAALLVARVGSDVVRRTLFPDVLWPHSVFHPRLLLFTLAVAVGTGLLAGLLPALQWSRADVVASLRGAGRTASGRSRTRSTLLVIQAALSTVLLIGAGLFVRSLDEVRSLDLGLDAPETLLLAVPERARSTIADRDFVWPVDEALERIRTRPAVSRATAAITYPFGNSWSVTFSVPGRTEEEMRAVQRNGPYINPVAGDYFATLGLEIVQGRALDASDIAGSERVAVVGSEMARILWPGESALDRCVYVGGQGEEPQCTTVVGVVEDARRNSIEEDVAAQYYVPIGQRRLDQSLAFMVRLAPGADASAVAEDLRREILDWAPASARHVSVQTLQERIDPQARAWSMGASLFSVFGALATAVAAIGLYGVLAFDVAQRTREIGVRAALGASAATLRRMVVSSGFRLTALGVALGTVAALALGPQFEDLLFQVSPREPGVLVSVALLLLAISAVAAWLPALRATRVDPNVALRE